MYQNFNKTLFDFLMHITRVSDSKKYLKALKIFEAQKNRVVLFMFLQKKSNKN